MSDTTSEKNRIQFHPAANLAAAANQAPDWIFKDFIEKREQVILFGPPKTGKSQLALQIALAAAKNEKFLRWQPTAAKKVLYFNFEISRRQFARRLAQLIRGTLLPEAEEVPSDFPWPELLWFYGGTLEERSLIIHERENGPSFKKRREELKAQIQEISPELIIFDTLSYMHQVDENSNVEVTQLLESIRELAGEAAHVVVHHTRKQSADRDGRRDYSTDSIRGATAIRGSADLILGLFPHPGGKGGGKHFRFEIEARNIPSDSFSIYPRAIGGFQDKSLSQKARILEFLEAYRDIQFLELRDSDAQKRDRNRAQGTPPCVGKKITEVPKGQLVAFLIEKVPDIGQTNTVGKLLEQLVTDQEIEFTQGTDHKTQYLVIK